MGNKESFQNKEKIKNPLAKAYFEIHQKEPYNLEEWQIAERIVEVLDDTNWINKDLAKECIYHIVHVLSYPDEKTRKEIILNAEEKARIVFPELANINEVHMDQIEYVYNKWKEKQKYE